MSMTYSLPFEEDAESWRDTQPYQDLTVFLRRLNKAVVGFHIPWSSESSSQAILSMVALIDTLDEWIEAIPPLGSQHVFRNAYSLAASLQFDFNQRRLLSSFRDTPELLPRHYTNLARFDGFSLPTTIHTVSLALAWKRQEREFTHYVSVRRDPGSEPSH
ncbi:hypothetical protein F5890DRAFT_1557878 [Lentinula detonsa]|uniref:Uncharacterized protein n=1 Tax=Lentinula detonsa TaxID=2804962 RepID=A0AA38PRY9_9AGAR|nr:hypothetical protein F5890DRAFT_1557878 [Lentinula detonsa]